jgi:hypothetical protein
MTAEQLKILDEFCDKECAYILIGKPCKEYDFKAIVGWDNNVERIEKMGLKIIAIWPYSADSVKLGLKFK